MADEAKEEPLSEEEQAAAAKKKKLIKIGGGAAGLVLAAWVAATMAAPKPEEYKTFLQEAGAPVLPDAKLQPNLKGEGGTRFVILDPSVLYQAYDPVYVETRTADPIYALLAKDLIYSAAGQRTSDDMLDTGMKEVFARELRDEIDLILFPVHIGDADLPTDADSVTGIKPGTDILESTLRTPLYDQKLFVDAPLGTIRMGDGPEVRFTGEEKNLRIEDGSGYATYLDLTELDPEFQGNIRIGTHGRVNRLLLGGANVQ